MYECSGLRSNKWIKIKNKSLVGADMKDTLDLIPIGAYYGKGKRKGYYGSFLMAAFCARTMTF